MSLLLLFSGAATPPAPSGVTWDPAATAAGLALSDGNLVATVPNTEVGANRRARASIGVSSGKVYWETVHTVCVNAATPAFGLMTSAVGLTEYISQTANEDVGHYRNMDDVWPVGITGQKYPQRGQGDVTQHCLDADNDLYWIGKNNVWVGNPAAGTGGISLPANKTWYPFVILFDVGDTATGRFAAASQAYAAPTGFSALDQAAPAVEKIYKGNQTIANLLLGTKTEAQLYLGAKDLV